MNIPVLSIIYCNVFSSLGNVIVNVDRDIFQPKNLTIDVMEWKLSSPWNIFSENISFPTDSRSGGILLY